ncbi:GTPase ObgE [bacterium]|nr:GTPase ObgE [bacterium]
MFIDKARITVEAGKGGNGCVSFHHERSRPKGGPDGGDGGRGGDVIFKADPSQQTLLDFHYRHKFRADNGQHGKGNCKTGRDGASKIVNVPRGTLVKDAETGKLICDLDTGEIVVARGGKGGRGNAQFATSRNTAPIKSEDGQPGEIRELLMELRIIADVGLVGLPNAGKSTFLARVTHAKPKIAAYPFSTISPNLGIVSSYIGEKFIIADIPGLIEGAHDGKGLGFEFLRHISRTKILLFIIDVSKEDPEEDYRTLAKEIKLYDESLVDKKSIIVFNKIDIVQDYEDKGFKIKGIDNFFISAVTGKGVENVIKKIWEILSRLRSDEE